MEVQMAESTNYKIRIEGEGLSLNREVSKEIGEKIVVLLFTGNSTTPVSAPTVQTPVVPAPTEQTPVVPAPTEQTPVVPAPEITIPTSEKEPTPSAKTQQTVCEPEMSIREFLDSCGAKRCPDKITAIGMYLKKYCDADDFSREDLIAHFEKAAESVPKNLTRDIRWTLKSGWITLRNGSEDCYYVTNSGNIAVEQEFSKEVIQKTKGMASGAKKTTTKAGK
jgi:hypothetical protein